MKIKRFTAVLLSIILGAAFTVMSSAAYLGDANLDYDVTAGDARMVLRAAVFLDGPLSPESFASADTDSNGEITASDARTILRAAVGLHKFYKSWYMSEITYETPQVFESRKMRPDGQFTETNYIDKEDASQSYKVTYFYNDEGMLVASEDGSGNRTDFSIRKIPAGRYVSENTGSSRYESWYGNDRKFQQTEDYAHGYTRSCDGLGRISAEFSFLPGSDEHDNLTETYSYYFGEENTPKTVTNNLLNNGQVIQSENYVSSFNTNRRICRKDHFCDGKLMDYIKADNINENPVKMQICFSDGTPDKNGYYEYCYDENGNFSGEKLFRKKDGTFFLVYEKQYKYTERPQDLA